MNKRDFVKQLAATSISMTVAPAMAITAYNPGSSGEQAIKSEGLLQASLLPLDLPRLAYGYSDLEPVIDARTMEVHHSKHHQGYINKLKVALRNEKVESFETLFSLASKAGTLRDNGGGHFNHSLFWESLAPGGKGPSGAFLTVVKKYFGSINGLQTALIEGGTSVFGSGWVWLVKDGNGHLKITTTLNQDNPLMKDVPAPGIPLLGIDVWEHAYYLKYQGLREQYLSNIMNILNWEVIEKRFNV